MTRIEHLNWCKQRALEYLPRDPDQAFASMASDMRKHPETDTEALPMLVGIGLFVVTKGSEAVRRWIEGFN